MLYTIYRYPAEWIDRWTMHDGSIATVRPILPQDAPLEAALVEGLSSESRYARFLVGGGRLTDEMLAAYTQIDYVNHMALVVSVARADGTGEDLIADGRFAATSAAVMRWGTISLYTFNSRTRRAMSCAYCAPKSTTSTVSCR